MLIYSMKSDSKVGSVVSLILFNTLSLGEIYLSVWMRSSTDIDWILTSLLEMLLGGYWYLAAEGVKEMEAIGGWNQTPGGI